VKWCQKVQSGGSLEQRDDRSRWPAGRATRATALAAVLVAGVLAGASLASAAVIVSYSAKSGGFHAGRVTLRGVSGRARYVTDVGRSGTVSLRRLHRRVFLPGKPPTGVLHIAGRSHDLAFRLSKPRYTGSRGTASYTVKPLPGTSRLRTPAQFGDASLTILPNRALGGGGGGGGLGSTANGPGLGGGGGKDCEMTVSTSLNTDVGNISLVSDSQWDTDDWLTAPAYQIADGRQAYMGSEGGFLRGCGMQVVYTGGIGTPVTITIDLSWQWNGPITTTCTVSVPSLYGCFRVDAGVIGWRVYGPR
jgi:hypothetical protein